LTGIVEGDDDADIGWKIAHGGLFLFAGRKVALAAMKFCL
jgi:hypothetical protein